MMKHNGELESSGGGKEAKREGKRLEEVQPLVWTNREKKTFLFLFFVESSEKKS